MPDGVELQQSCPVQDVLEQLRPELRRFESFKEACDAVTVLEAAAAAAMAANGGLAPIEEDDSDEEPESVSAAFDCGEAFSTLALITLRLVTHGQDTCRCISCAVRAWALREVLPQGLQTRARHAWHRKLPCFTLITSCFTGS